jgi:hypothetical protein
MAASDSALEAGQLLHARALLERSARKERIWPAALAAAAFAASALAFAVAMVAEPPLVNEHAARAALR